MRLAETCRAAPRIGSGSGGKLHLHLNERVVARPGLARPWMKMVHLRAVLPTQCLSHLRDGRSVHDFHRACSRRFSDGVKDVTLAMQAFASQAEKRADTGVLQVSLVSPSTGKKRLAKSRPATKPAARYTSRYWPCPPGTPSLVLPSGTVSPVGWTARAIRRRCSSSGITCQPSRVSRSSGR